MRILDKLDRKSLERLVEAVDGRTVRRAVEELDSPEVMKVLDWLDRPSVVVGMSLAVAALLARKHTESAIAIGLAAPLAVGIGDLLKRAVRARTGGLGGPARAAPAGTGAWDGAATADDGRALMRRGHR